MASSLAPQSAGACREPQERIVPHIARIDEHEQAQCGKHKQHHAERGAQHPLRPTRRGGGVLPRLFHAEPAEQGEHHRQNQERRPVMADIRRGQNRAEQHGKQHRDARKPPPAEALALLGLCRLHRFAAQPVEPFLRALDAACAARL